MSLKTALQAPWRGPSRLKRSPMRRGVRAVASLCFPMLVRPFLENDSQILIFEHEGWFVIPKCMDLVDGGGGTSLPEGRSKDNVETKPFCKLLGDSFPHRFVRVLSSTTIPYQDWIILAGEPTGQKSDSALPHCSASNVWATSIRFSSSKDCHGCDCFACSSISDAPGSWRVSEPKYCFRWKSSVKRDEEIQCGSERFVDHGSPNTTSVQPNETLFNSFDGSSHWKTGCANKRKNKSSLEACIICKKSRKSIKCLAKHAQYPSLLG